MTADSKAPWASSSWAVFSKHQKWAPSEVFCPRCADHWKARFILESSGPLIEELVL